MAINLVFIPYHDWRKIEDEYAKMIEQHLLAHCKYKTLKDLKKHVLHPLDHWMTAAEMKKHGLCDEILQERKKIKKKAGRKKKR